MCHAEKRSELIKQRDALRARIDAIRCDYRKGLDRDLSEQAVQLENSEVLEEILRVTLEQCTQVENQLKELQAANPESDTSK